MCIRDSRRTGGCGASREEPGDVAGDGGDGAGNAARDGDAAVSYTHLRAHETVLDLVCRLLLETKTPDSARHRLQ